jgi:pantothenate kinase
MSAQRTIDLPGLVAHLLSTQREARRLVAIAGAPGSGKSTFTEQLCARLNETAAGSTCVLAMDGFHFDDRVLESRGHRARKGAPYIFDVAGLAAVLHRLKANDGAEVAVPVFDRSLEIARAAAAIIPACRASSSWKATIFCSRIPTGPLCAGTST